MGMFGRRDNAEVAGLRAEVESLQSRLSSDVSTLDPDDSPLCRQAMNDASERNTAAGGLLSRATTPAELQVAMRIVVEGLQATRVVREHQGLSLGPDLPNVTGPAAVQAPTQVTVGGAEMTAHPEYHPEQPHFFGGGTVAGSPVPGGYYRTPFWKKAMMIGSAVAGGEMLGDLLGGGGNGGGWDGGGGGGWDGGGGDGW
jgi:hypothetical protein